MLKITLIACAAACAGGGSVAWWLNPQTPHGRIAIVATEMPSIADLNYRAGARTLPDTTVLEPF